MGKEQASVILEVVSLSLPVIACAARTHRNGHLVVAPQADIGDRVLLLSPLSLDQQATASCFRKRAV
jgi:hypothetical protein